MEEPNYFIFWMRFQRQNGYLLWIEGSEKDCFWTADSQHVPAYRTQEKLVKLAQQQGFPLKNEQPHLIDFDVVITWINNPEKMPPSASLDIWNAFADLSQSIKRCFDGNTKSPVRNRVFELLYVTSGVWRRLGYNSAPAIWPRQERTVLRRIMRQGFRLWSKHVYWAD